MSEILSPLLSLLARAFGPISSALSHFVMVVRASGPILSFVTRAAVTYEYSSTVYVVSLAYNMHRFWKPHLPREKFRWWAWGTRSSDLARSTELSARLSYVVLQYVLLVVV